jgi:hypothetical protein
MQKLRVDLSTKYMILQHRHIHNPKLQILCSSCLASKGTAKKKVPPLPPPLTVLHVGREEYEGQLQRKYSTIKYHYLNYVCASADDR